MKGVNIALITILVLLIVSSAHATVIRVLLDYPTIQGAIDAASDGDTVLVPNGTYTGEGNKELDFGGKAITVTSENGAKETIIDCEGSGSGFIFHSGEGGASVVSGFTISNGNGYYDDGAYSPDAGHYGGGIFCYESSPTITNNIIAGNAADKGGGVFCRWKSSPTITNNTITGNAASAGGGILGYAQSFPTLTNNILWNDSPDEISLWYNSSITVTYSDVQGGWQGEGNINAEPLFVDPDGGDYHLQAGSPCINAGTSDGAPLNDIEGTPRNPDIGAYEYQEPVSVPLASSILFLAGGVGLLICGRRQPRK